MAQGIGLTALARRLYRTRHLLCLRADEAHLLRPDRGILGALVAKGLPMGLHMAVVSMAAVMMMSLVNRFGAQLSAAYGACLQLWNYIQLPVLAMGMAVTPMAAQNLGARRLDRVGRIARTGIALNIAMAGGMVLVLQCFSRAVLGLFLPAQPETLQAAQHINAMVAWAFVPVGVTFVLGSVIRASGTAIPPLVILFLALWCIRQPAAVLLMDAWGADALWLSFGLGSVSSMLMSLAYYRWAGWRAAFLPTDAPAAEHAAKRPRKIRRGALLRCRLVLPIGGMPGTDLGHHARHAGRVVQAQVQRGAVAGRHGDRPFRPGAAARVPDPPAAGLILIQCGRIEHGLPEPIGQPDAERLHVGLLADPQAEKPCRAATASRPARRRHSGSANTDAASP